MCFGWWGVRSPPSFFLIYKEMARSSLPGAHSPIRGKLGDTVYQVTRNAQGKTTQLQKAAETSRENPNTEAQARARMVMGMIQRMFHGIPEIIKDAYFRTPRGTLSFQHFAKLNYQKLADDRDDHWESGSLFDWRPKFDVTPPAGPWILADGDYHNMTYDRIVTELVDSNLVTFEWQNTDDCRILGDFLNRMNIVQSDEIWLIYYLMIRPDDVPEIKVARFRIDPHADLQTPFDDVEWYDLLEKIDGEIETYEFINWGDGTVTMSFSEFNKSRWVVANATVMVVNYDIEPMRFSSAVFDWFVRIQDDRVRRWYGIQSPSDVWSSWYQESE